MSVTRPRLHRNATSQQVVLDALFERPGQVVQAAELVERLYVSDSPATRANLHQVLVGLRKRLPGLEIETVLGYRLRRRSA